MIFQTDNKEPKNAISNTFMEKNIPLTDSVNSGSDCTVLQLDLYLHYP